MGKIKFSPSGVIGFGICTCFKITRVKKPVGIKQPVSAWIHIIFTGAAGKD
jgi:hypothetical protein